MHTEHTKDLSCVVITPVGPDHDCLVEQCQTSVRQGFQSPNCVFSKVKHILIDDQNGVFGRSAARNLGIRKALEQEADWIFFLDADDLLVPDAFDKIEPYLAEYEAIWGQIYTFNGSDENAHKLSGQLEFTNDIKDILFVDPALTLRIGHFLKRQVAIENPFNENLDAGEDFDHFLRIWARYKCAKITHALCATRLARRSTGPRSTDQSERKRATEKAIKRFKISNVQIPPVHIPRKYEWQSMDIAIFGVMRSGTTLLADLLTIKNRSILLHEPVLLNVQYNKHKGAELFEFQKLMKQLQDFGFDVSGMRYWDKTKYPSFIQFFNSNIYPLLAGLKMWGAKMIEFDDWQGFLAAFRPQKLILTVRDVRDVVLSAFDLALRLNRKYGTVVDEAWIENKTIGSCRQIMKMTQLPHLLVRYEDLCSNPDVCSRVAEFAAIDELSSNRPSFENVLPHRRYELEKHGSGVSDSSVFRHRSEPYGPVLALANRVWRLCAEYSDMFGYERPSSDISIPTMTSGHSTPLSISDYPDLLSLQALHPALSRREARKVAISLIPSGSVVLDLSCGTMSLESILPEGCDYIPCDVMSRHDRMVICDFNRTRELPDKKAATIIVVIGLIEYIEDVPFFLKALQAYNLPIILTYHPKDLSGQLDRASFGWVNHLSSSELIEALDDSGFTVSNFKTIGDFQLLLHLIPRGAR